MGEYPTQWDKHLNGIAERGYNMVHFTPKVYGELEKPKVVIKATGNALTKAVTAAEVIKRRFKGLHQITALGSVEIVDEYEPLEEGLEKVTDTRTVSTIEITLSKDALDTANKGCSSRGSSGTSTGTAPCKQREKGRKGARSELNVREMDSRNIHLCASSSHPSLRPLWNDFNCKYIHPRTRASSAQLQAGGRTWRW